MSIEAIFPGGLSTFFFTLVRTLGLLMVAPVFAVRLVPARVRIALGFALALLLSGVVPAVPTPDSWAAAGWIVAKEVFVGAALGFGLQIIFDALIIAGQTIAMSMGLGFAMLVDTQNGVPVPVVSQFFVIVGTLVFLALDGHLATVELLADSFRWLPIGQGLTRDGIWLSANWATAMFEGAVRVALPAIAAILVVNIAFGVMSRAAPTLNLFAVGFPATMLLGFLVLIVTMKGFAAIFGELVDSSFARAIAVLGA